LHGSFWRGQVRFDLDGFIVFGCIHALRIRWPSAVAISDNVATCKKSQHLWM
jgi:hypothetical protein